MVEANGVSASDVIKKENDHMQGSVDLWWKIFMDAVKPVAEKYFGKGAGVEGLRQLPHARCQRSGPLSASGQ